MSDDVINPDAEKRDLAYQDLLIEFGKEQLEEMFIFIVDRARFYIKFFESNYNVDASHFQISETYIKEVIIDYFADIKRLKPFHNIKEIHPIKRAAYLGYWLTRRKPIQLVKDFTQEELEGKDRLTSINEGFTVLIIMAVLFVESNSVPETHSVNVQKFYHHLHYHLKYRVINPQILELAIVGFYTNQLFTPQYK
ncbi:MAG: hypothetical protein Q8N03_03920 [Ignavibacteria bacterium]|nr:hypothetical protein [Ignavibacteria bacterium]